MKEFRSLTDRLVAFNGRFGLPVRTKPTVIDNQEEIDQFLGKLDEEVTELRRAVMERELVRIADGLGDALYVIAGVAVQYGLDIDQIIDTVHRSNMTKGSSKTGGPVKGDAYRRPMLEAIFRAKPE